MTRCRRCLPLLVAGCLLGGCWGPPEPEESADDLTGSRLTVALEAGSPLAAALRNGLNDFEATTGATVALEVAEPDGPIDRTADLCVVGGATLATLTDLRPLGPEVTDDLSLGYRNFPANWLVMFDKRAGEPVALPLAVDAVLLYHRRDLFADEAVRTAYRERHGAELMSPRTWDDYLRIAAFFAERGEVEFGCVEPTAPADVVRTFFVHAAAYLKRPYEYSFALDVETGKPRLTHPGFVRALTEMRRAVQAGPGLVDAAEADRLFVAGRAALLLGRRPPTVGASKQERRATSGDIAVSQVPGADEVYPADPTRPAVRAGEANRPVHYATTGWYVLFGAEPTAASRRLLLFLTRPDENLFLVQAAREGLLPAHSDLRREPSRWAAYGLKSQDTTSLFGALADTLDADNFVTDLRFAGAEPLRQALAEQLAAALKGAVTPEQALEAADGEWERILAADRLRLLNAYRDSVALPPLSADELP